jgi:hypothetical protein
VGEGIEDLPEWERLLAAERHVQHLVPGSVLVGGAAAAFHAARRVSLDGDHVLEDLRDRFDDVLAALEGAAGWQTERAQRPVLILGAMSGMLTGIRQLRRTRPLETEVVAGLRVPTLAEVAERLAAAAPADLASIDLASYRGLREPWTDLGYLSGRGRAWAAVLARVALEESP